MKQKLSLARIATVVSSLALVGAYVAYRALWTGRPVVDAASATAEARPSEAVFSGSKRGIIFSPKDEQPKEFIGSSKLGIILKPGDLRQVTPPPADPPVNDPEANMPGNEKPSRPVSPDEKPDDNKRDDKKPDAKKPNP